jgi:hypothetical protein
MTSVPNGVDTERSAHAEPPRHLVAHRAQLAVELAQLSLA